MILSTINNSIGNREKHFKMEDLVLLFNNFNVEKVEPNEEYIIDTIFKEATLKEFIDFLKENKIHIKKAKKIYEYFKLEGINSERFEWFFSKVQITN